MNEAVSDREKALLAFAGQIYKDSALLSDLSPKQRIVDNLEDLKVIVDFFKAFNADVVLTMGHI